MCVGIENIQSNLNQPKRKDNWFFKGPLDKCLVNETIWFFSTQVHNIIYLQCMKFKMKLK